MASLCATVHDPKTMILQMVVFPDNDQQLDDPAFNPVGMIHTRHNLTHVRAMGHGAFRAAIPGLILNKPVPIPMIGTAQPKGTA